MEAKGSRHRYCRTSETEAIDLENVLANEQGIKSCFMVKQSEATSFSSIKQVLGRKKKSDWAQRIDLVRGCQLREAKGKLAPLELWP